MKAARLKQEKWRDNSVVSEATGKATIKFYISSKLMINAL